MDEYEKLEEEATMLYEKYVAKYRNMMYLDFCLEGYEKAEKDRMQVSWENTTMSYSSISIKIDFIP